MKYGVKYECGHEGMVELFGKECDRERRLYGMAHGLCPECWKKEKETKMIETEKSLELPELTGSEKQVAWARTIRSEALSTMRIDLPIDYRGPYVEYIKTKNEARFWIDNRSGAWWVIKKQVKAMQNDQ